MPDPSNRPPGPDPPAARGPSRAARIWKRTWIGALMVLVLVGLLAWVDRSERGTPIVVAAVLMTLLAVVEVRGMGLFRARTWPAGAALALWVLLALWGLHGIWSRFGTGGLASLLVLSKIGDIAGYYVGNALGRSHPFPRLSPGKTTAGCVASLAAGVVAGALLVATGALPAGGAGVLVGALAGGAVNVAAQAGDLAESWIKRRTGVKDSGTWFGPAGGVLDLVDSLLLAVPCALGIWPLFFTA